MSLSGMPFLLLLGLIIFGPKKLPQVSKQISRALTELRSFTRDFKSQLEIEMEGVNKQENIAPVSLPQRKLPTETGSRVLETDALGSEREPFEAFHG